MVKKWIPGLIYVCGFLLLCYPTISNLLQRQRQKDAITATALTLTEENQKEQKKILQDARQYNSMLFQSEGAIVNNMDQSILSDESYMQLLNPSACGVMGSVQIPKISVSLPIYHGTSDEVLSCGAGHQQGTSLPVGGENTHCILSGHRGLPGSRLFTRLDELEKGDLFFLSVLGETLAYKVRQIQIIEPENTEIMAISAGEDICSLVTCTPYGLNTHRLVVSGERVSYRKKEFEQIRAVMPSWREMLFTALPFLISGIMLALRLTDWRKSRMKKKRKRRKKRSTYAHISVFGLSILWLLGSVFSVHAEEQKTELLNQKVQNPPILQYGSVRVQLAEGEKGTSYEGVVLSCTKVASVVNGNYILTENFHEAGVDLNSLQNTKDLEDTVGKLEGILEGKKPEMIQKTDHHGQSVFEHLEPAVYLIRAEDTAKYEKIMPSMVSVPFWDEMTGEMQYQVSVIPKHSPHSSEEPPEKPAPQTNVSSPVLRYFGAALILLAFLILYNCLDHRSRRHL